MHIGDDLIDLIDLMNIVKALNASISTALKYKF